MNSIVSLLRPEIRRLRPYRNAVFEPGLARLNANENPWPPPGDSSDPGLNWYPEAVPVSLQNRLAMHYGVAQEQLLVTRGSSEAIDLLVRGFCRAGQDTVVICPPTFGMYEVYAQVQGAAVRVVPLRREQDYTLDVDGIVGDWTETDRLVFVCSPNNPTGNLIALADIARLAEQLRGRGCLVLDAAYAEFSGSRQSIDLIADFDNVVVLRTLSKAMALAGVRCGALIGAREVVDLIGRILPPYAFPTPCARAAEACIEPGNAAEWRRRVDLLVRERARMSDALAALPAITRVWPSSANFILVETRDPRDFAAAAKRGRVLVRDFSWDPYLPRCVRITIGTPAENDQLLAALG